MKADMIIRSGLGYIGTPYQFNAPPNRSDAFDCSSFVQYIFRQHGIILPRNSRQQFLTGQPVSPNSIRKGDLLFFTTKSRRMKRGIAKVGHVAVYAGHDQLLHTYEQAGGVSVTKFDDYWKSMFVGAKRLL